MRRWGGLEDQKILCACLLYGRHAARDPVHDAESCKDYGSVVR